MMTWETNDTSRPPHVISILFSCKAREILLHGELYHENSQRVKYVKVHESEALLTF